LQELIENVTKAYILKLYTFHTLLVHKELVIRAEQDGKTVSMGRYGVAWFAVSKIYNVTGEKGERVKDAHVNTAWSMVARDQQNLQPAVFDPT